MEYKGYLIHQCPRNSSGMRYWCFGNNGRLMADTLKGLKSMISREVQNV